MKKLFIILIIIGEIIVADKVYQPEVIEETPFPEETSESVGQSVKSVSGDTYSPTVSKDKSFKKTQVARELLSRALNTKSKKILQNFELQESGGLQMGNYQDGEYGDIRLTRLGIVMRDTAGNITVAMYAEDGSAVFKGTVQAGSLISASSIVGGSININDVFTVDEDGNVEAASMTITGGTIDINGNFTVDASGNVAASSLALTGGSINLNNKFIVDSSGNVTVNTGQITVKDDSEATVIDSKGLVSTANFIFDNYAATNNITTTSTAFEDVSGSELSFTLSREARVLILYNCNIRLANAGASEYFLHVTVDVDGTDTTYLQSTYSKNTISTIGTTLTAHAVKSFSAGSHAITLRWRIDHINSTGNMFNRSLTYLVLGK